ncbi:pyrroline-5-carboxylate reductase [uncultured Sulfitobacter sp.]|uniref:pyrroline-5-carboxylate reductase n=1 Tax=uncultured Sulfitobacter sp. TaxID=191468 RepID=UPI002626EBD7|nr:pyrroline-5-carboxylate reductase [uncultured Sulfitobacter sp.]
MKDGRIATQGLVLLGCGKMGSAMLAGWLARGLPTGSVWVQDPQPSDWLKEQGVHLNAPLPEAPALVLVAVKPQMMGDALPSMAALGNGETVFVSVAAGTPISYFEQTLGADTPVVRAMPNTPAAISKGITAIVGNGAAGAAALDEAEALLSAVGEVVRLDAESQIDAVTGVSGSGPAYVFHMIECLAAAGEAQGLSAALSLQLAKATVAGAGALAAEAAEDPAQLRVNVTSPNGTTQAALEVLMDAETGFPALLPRAVKAATDRSRELARDA